MQRFKLRTKAYVHVLVYMCLYVLCRLKFISSNLMFYTVLFQEFLPRAFRQDLTSPKNAIVLFRVAKVLAQSNLAMVLQEGKTAESQHMHTR